MIINLLILLAGASLLMAGLYQGRKLMRLKQTGIRTTGIVVSNRLHINRMTGWTYFPTVEFTDVEGTLHSVELEFGSMPRLPINSEVELLYDPQKPEEAVRHDPLNTTLAPVLLILSGLVGLTFALLQLLGITHFVI